MPIFAATNSNSFIMVASFIELYKGSPHHYYLNLCQVEQVNPESNEVWMESGECYTLNDDDFSAVMKYVNANMAGYGIG